MSLDIEAHIRQGVQAGSKIRRGNSIGKQMISKSGPQKFIRLLLVIVKVIPLRCPALGDLNVILHNMAHLVLEASKVCVVAIVQLSLVINNSKKIILVHGCRAGVSL